jgi:uncharacterized protein
MYNYLNGIRYLFENIVISPLNYYTIRRKKLAMVNIIRIRKDKAIDISGGIVLDGLPSAGVINAIASKCLIRSIGTELVAILDSPDFPPISIIDNFVPNFPARIYLNEELKISFFMTDLEIDKSMHRSVAQKMLEWTIKNECKLIISAAATPYSNNVSDHDNMNMDVGNSNPAKVKFPVFAASSTESAARKIREAGLSHLCSGIVAGIPGILLNEGALAGLDVIVLIVNVIKNMPDFHAAAVISEAISKLVPGIYCDIGSLMSNAQLAENRIKDVRESQLKSGFHGDIYR